MRGSNVAQDSLISTSYHLTAVLDSRSFDQVASLLYRIANPRRMLALFMSGSTSVFRYRDLAAQRGSLH